MVEYVLTFEVTLRILDIHGAKITKNQTPLTCFALTCQGHLIIDREAGR